MDDSRARERRRQIEEQKAVATRLLRQVSSTRRWFSPVDQVYPVSLLTRLWFYSAAVQRRAAGPDGGGVHQGSPGEGGAANSHHRGGQAAGGAPGVH